MSDFVEQCRSEWKRLGVPDPLAEEMAADLASDLRMPRPKASPPRSSSEAVPSIRVRSLPPGQPSEGSSPHRPAEGMPAADRSSSWRSPASQRSQ